MEIMLICSRFVVLATTFSLVHSNISDCYLNITNGKDGHLLPIILQRSWPDVKYVLPHRGAIIFKPNQPLILACPGRRNYLQNAVFLNAEEATAECVKGKVVEINGSKVNFGEVKCKKSVPADINEANGKCGITGKLKLIGHSIGEHQFLRLISVCYQEDAGRTLYTQHDIDGAEIKYAAKNTKHPSFGAEGLGSTIAASIAYNKNFQKSTFNSLLGSAVLAERYINDSSFLAAGHLAPKADFLLPAFQRCTYFYLNVCPQWQSINNGNWKSLEFDIRKTAKSYNKTFTVLTGTYDILTLPDYEKKQVEIYLNRGNTLPVPKYLWKILYDPDTKFGIAIIILNNPFTDALRNVEICQNICGQYGWHKDTWSHIPKGYVFCCKITDLKLHVKHVPPLQVRGVLYGIY